MSSDEPKPPLATLTPPPASGDELRSEDTLSHGTMSVSPEPGGKPASSARRGGYLPTFSAGELVAGRYRIVRFIAKGGMGEVYEARDDELGERVALKTVRPEIAEQPGTVQRFKREIQLARRVGHPNVCRIFDLGRHKSEAPGAPTFEVVFLTMELLEGETLSQRVKKAGRIPLPEALRIVQQMASALQTAHEAGIIHRDFKSSNVMLAPARGGGERVVVTDFGLARGSLEGGDASLTGTGDIVGTPAYMAPEQVGGGKLGPAADIYALGVVIFEMTTASLPFPGDSPLSVALKRLNEDPIKPLSVVPDLDPVWDGVILRCLARDPEERFASADDVVRALKGEQVAPPRRRSRLPDLRKRPWAAALAAGVIAVLGYGLFSLRSPAPPAPAPASVSPPPAAAPSVKLRRSVAVLGFKNLGRPDAAWLSTAIAEMLRTELAAGGTIRTIPGESVTRMKLELSLEDQDSLAPETLARVRDNVGADLVVAGSYLTLPGTAPQRIRLDLRLQDTRAGELLASAAEEGTEDDVFGVVGRAGARLREGLGVSPLSPADAAAVRAAFPSDPAVGRFYAEGLAKLRVFDALGAKESFEKATARDPNHPLVHAALASSWSTLGYDSKARQAVGRALELSKELPREQRLVIEGLHHEMNGDWARAVEIYRGLFVFLPDSLDHGLRLAGAQTAAGDGKSALSTLESLRRLPKPASADPRIDLAEAAAAKALTDFERQRRAAVQAAQTARAQRAQLLFAQARLSEGQALSDLGRLDEARAACEEARAVFAVVGDQASAARADNVVAVALAKGGKVDEARAGFEKALQSFRGIGDQQGVARQLNNVAMLDRRAGRHAQAQKSYDQALGITREIGDKSGEARALNNLGLVLFEMKDLAGAKRHYEAALKAFVEMGEKRNEALAHSNLGEVAARQGRNDEAQESYRKAIAVAREAGARAHVANCSLALGRLLAAGGKHGEARTLLEEARRLYQQEKNPKAEADVLLTLADCLAKQGDSKGAESARKQAEALAAPARGR